MTDVGYAYGRSEKDLIAAGAHPDHLFIDHDKERLEQTAMLAHGLRKGDTLLLIAANDLGGSTPAHQRIVKRLEAQGVTVEVRPLETPPGRVGRPPKLDPDPQQDLQIARLWIDEKYTDRYKLRRVGEIMGREIARHQLIYRYGTVETPKVQIVDGKLVRKQEPES